MNSETRQETLRELETVLSGQEGLQESDRAAIMREVHDALAQADKVPQASTFDAEKLRATWMEMVDGIGTELDASERDAWVRQVERALEPLSSAHVQDAVSYERKRASLGEEAAAAWLNERNEQRRKADAESSTTVLPSGVKPNARHKRRARRT